MNKKGSNQLNKNKTEGVKTQCCDKLIITIIQCIVYLQIQKIALPVNSARYQQLSFIHFPLNLSTLTLCQNNYSHQRVLQSIQHNSNKMKHLSSPSSELNLTLRILTSPSSITLISPLLNLLLTAPTNPNSHTRFHLLHKYHHPINDFYQIRFKQWSKSKPHKRISKVT